MNSIPALLTPLQIEQYGFLLETALPKPATCQFCHKELFYRGIRSLISKVIIRWTELPERCCCERAIQYWEKVDQEKAQTEAERLKKIEQDERLAKVKRLFDQSKMGERFKTRTFENFKVDSQNTKAFRAMKMYADNFSKYVDQGIGILLTGPYGGGKTYLAAALAHDLINRGVPVVFGTMITLLGKIKGTYSGNRNQEDESEILETYASVDLLIIDDLGKERVSEWSLEKLFSIVNERYENNLPIVLTSNYSMETLIDKLSITKDGNKNSDVAESLVSRLYEMCRGIRLNTSDRRKEKYEL
jgi:DNA replication protein DnaC